MMNRKTIGTLAIAGLIAMAIFVGPAAADGYAYIIASNSTSIEFRQNFETTDDVYAWGRLGDESRPDQEGGRVYVVIHQERWSNGDPLNDVSGGYDIVNWVGAGQFRIKAWSKDLTPGKYNLILDLDVTGYNGVWTKIWDPYASRYIIDPIWLFEVVEREIPDLTVSPESWDFGSVTEGSQPQQTFKITNDGNADLVINDITPPCSYISISDISLSATITPDSSETFTATVDTTGLSGSISEIITINSNDPDEGTVDIGVSGEVGLPDLTVSPDYWDFGTIYPLSPPQEKNFILTNVGDADIIIDDMEKTDWITLLGFTHGTISPTDSEEFTVTIDYVGLPIGAVSGEIIILSNDPDGDLRVSIEAKKAPFSPPNQVYNFDAYPDLEKKGEIVLKWKNPISTFYKGTIIRYDTEDYPLLLNDGTFVCDVEGNPDENNECKLEANYDNKYYFTAFSYDEFGQYSPSKAILSLRYIPGIPHLYEPDFGGHNDEDCAPVAAARILGYWDDHGYPKLVDEVNGEEDYNALVEDLKKEMGWDASTGTNFDKIPFGIRKVCNGIGYNSYFFLSYNTHDILLPLTWERVKHEIDIGHPPLYSSSDEPYGNSHTSHISGYIETGDTNSYIIGEININERKIIEFTEVGHIEHYEWEEDYPDILTLICPGSHGLMILGLSPIDLIVSDPDGLIINGSVLNFMTHS